MGAAIVRRHYWVEGLVQGVGFRYRSRYTAQALDLTGWVQNLDDGRVELVLQGDPDAIDQFWPMLQQSSWIRITNLREKAEPCHEHERGFRVEGY